MSAEPGGSILLAMLWMALIALLLFWLPVIGPLIAGIVGGRTAGGVLAGMAAVVLPALLFGAALFVFATSLTGIPVLGLLAASGGLVLALSQTGMLLIGAIIGGLLA